MKAVRLYGAGDIRIEDVEMPQLERDEVLVKIHTCGICPSDVRPYLGNVRSSRKLPRFLGHEWAGEIVDMGSEVKNVKPGKRVAASWRVVCGVCEYCRRGDFNYCTSLNRERTIGGFAEYGRIKAANVFEIADAVSYEEASFAEPLACCLNGQERSGIKYGDDVVILGTGPIGILHAQLAYLRGARVIAADFLKDRIELALKLGAHQAVNLQEEDLKERVRELTAGKGADRVIVATGAVSAVADALDIAANCGNINIFAGIYPQKDINLDPNYVHYKQVELTGSHDYVPKHFQTALKMIEHGVINVKALISHRFPLNQLERGLKIVAEKKGRKVMICCNNSVNP